MRAAVACPDGLELREIERPTPGPDQVLVRVVAAGFNRADLAAAKGRYGASKDLIGRPIGMEWAGEIVEVGSAVERFRPGEMVMAYGWGGYAEYAVSDQQCTLPVGRLDPRTAAAAPLTAMTAHDAVVTRARLRSGQAILVNGASTGVGLMAMQIARHLGARTIIGISSSDQRRARLHEFGATLALDGRAADWADQVLASTDGLGVDAVVDMVAGGTINQSMKAAKVCGRIVNVGRLGGGETKIDLNLHALRRLTLIGVTFRTRSPAEIRAIFTSTFRDLKAAMDSGEIRIAVDRRFTLAEALQAHAYAESNSHFGKLVITP